MSTNNRTTEDLIEIMRSCKGRIVQRRHLMENVWVDDPNPKWNWVHCDYRPKPLEFPPLPKGLEWHNPEWLTPEQVGSDRRLLVKGELDGRFSSDSNEHQVSWWVGGEWRTTNRIVGATGSYNTYSVPISTPFPEPPKPKVMVPLGPEDVPPGSAIRQNCLDAGWVIVSTVGSEGIDLNGIDGLRPYTFRHLKVLGYQIKRPGQDWQPCEKEVAP